MFTHKNLQTGVWRFSLHGQTEMPANNIRYGLGRDEDYLLVLHGFNRETNLLAPQRRPDLWSSSWFERAQHIFGGTEATTRRRFLLQAKLLRIPDRKPDDFPQIRLIALIPGATAIRMELQDPDANRYETRSIHYPDSSDWLKPSPGRAHVLVRDADGPVLLGSGEIDLPRGSCTTLLAADFPGAEHDDAKVFVHRVTGDSADFVKLSESASLR